MKIYIIKEVQYFIWSLEKPTIAKILRVIDLLEKFGNKLQMPHSKPIGKGLFELRIRGDKEIRIFYTFNDNQAVLLLGFIKKSRQIPKKEISLAYQKIKDLT